MPNLTVLKVFHIRAKTPSGLEKKLYDFQVRTGQIARPDTIYFDGQYHVAWMQAEVEVTYNPADVYKEVTTSIAPEAKS